MTPETPGWRARLRRRVTTKPFLVTVAVLAVLFLAYTLAGFFLVPRLIRTYVPQFAQEQLKRRAEIGEVRVNPLLFKVEIKHFRLQEADGQPLLGFDRLFVDFQTSSLFRRAWTFAAIHLEAPRLDVVLKPDGRLNLADLLDTLPKGEPAEKTEPAAPARMLLQHALVSGGVLSFTDRSGHAPQTATVEPIDVELRDISTLPGRRGPYAISATLTGGGVVTWEGDVSLVPVRSGGHLGLRGFPLATAWRFVQEDVALAEPAGRLDAEARYEFAYRDGSTSLTVDGIEVTLADLALTERGQKAPMLTLERIRLAGGRGDLIAREVTVPELTVSRGRLSAAIARDGTVNWQRLAARPAAAAGGTPTTPPAERTGAAPPTGAAGATPGAAKTKDAPASPTGAGGAPAQTTKPAPEARPWRVAMEKVRVEQLALAVLDESRATPLEAGVGDLTVDVGANLESGPAGLAGTADRLAVTLAGVTVGPAGAPKGRVLTLDRIALDDGRVDLRARHVAVGRLSVAGGATTVVRADDGSIPVVKMLAAAESRKPAPAGASRPRGGSARAAAAPAPPAGAWTVALDRFDLDNHRVGVTDRSVTPAAQVDLTGIKVTAGPLRTDGKKPFPFDAGFRVNQGGRFTVKGRAAPDGSSAEATLTLARLALAPAQPYIARTADVLLRSGDVSTTGRLTYRAGRERPAITYAGSADIDRISVVESASGEPVVSWSTLHAGNLRFGLAPDRLEIAEVRLAGLDGKVVIFQDKTLSVARLMKKPAGAPSPPAPGAAAGTPPAPDGASPAAPSPAAPEPAPTAAAAAEPPRAASGAPAPAANGAAPAFPLVVERVRVDDSSLSFADLSLVLPFATRIHGLTGVVVGLGSDPGSRATVKLDGRVDEFGQMKVDGALSALQPKVFTDLGVIFRNVPMSTLTPYSATFAGRRIVAGTMNLDLQYKIDRGALVGENKVVLTKLQLGERVESAGAMRLPLDLAIAILSDAQGRINIDLPVRGDVNHPQFSYGQLIWQALVTVVKKIVTSPFRALAGLFGGEADAERLQTVVFEPGSDVVQPPERQKLQRVAEVLGQRTQLKLVVHGGFEPKSDGEALRSRQVRTDLAQRLGVTVKPGEDPGPVAFDQVKTQRALEALLAARGGDKAVAEFQAAFEKRTGKKADRANPVLSLLGRGAGDRAFYQALFARLVETAPLGEGEVAALALRRAEATARVLKERAGAAAGRVEVGDSQAAGAGEGKTIPTRLELAAVAGS